MLFESQVIRAASSDARAFSKLYQHYLQPSYAFIAFRVNCTADAEDLTSELWMKVLGQLHTLENPQPEVFRAWLFTMARRLVIDHYRKQKLTTPLTEELEIPVNDASQAFLMEQKHIQELVRSLPAQQCEVISLKYFSGLRNKEIATLLELSEKTVASHLVRALQNLKKAMRGYTQ